MRTVALFNNKGGVGKTTLAYHLSHMFARLGLKTLAIDLDPQANLTSAFFAEEELESLWEVDSNTILSCVRPILEGTGDIAEPPLTRVAERLWVLPGDLGLSRFEDKLSESWNKGYSSDEAALRATSAFHRIVQRAQAKANASLALFDVGPNLGAINRSALIAADFLIIPLAADLYSLQGLKNLGPTTRTWRGQWQLVKKLVQVPFSLPNGEMLPVGYVVLQHAVRLDRPVRAYAKWLQRIPGVYREAVLGEEDGHDFVASENDPHCLASLRNYRSLMPMAQDTRKPMFDLRPADGAIGSHAQLVQTCANEFRNLAERIAERCGLEKELRRPVASF